MQNIAGKLSIPVARPFSKVPPPFGQCRTPFEAMPAGTDYWEIFDVVDVPVERRFGIANRLHARDFGTANRVWMSAPRSHIRKSRSWITSWFVGLVSGIGLAVMLAQRLTPFQDTEVSAVTVRGGTISQPKRTAREETPAASLHDALPAMESADKGATAHDSYVKRSRKPIIVHEQMELAPTYQNPAATQAQMSVRKKRGLRQGETGNQIQRYDRDEMIRMTKEYGQNSVNALDVQRSAAPIKRKDFVLSHHTRVTEWE